MEEMIVKNIDFRGDELLAVKDNDGAIWTAVNSLCRGMGLNKNERDRQVKNVQSDEVLKKGCVKFDAGVFDPDNETLALQLDYVPLWLAKISITPKMKENNPKLVEKLITYQLKAKDALAAAFIPTENKQSPETDGTIMRLYQNSKWYILTIGDEVYSLKPNEASMIARTISAMTKHDLGKVSDVVKTMIEDLGRECRLQCIRECITENPSTALENTKVKKDGG